MFTSRHVRSMLAHRQSINGCILLQEPFPNEQPCVRILKRTLCEHYPSSNTITLPMFLNTTDHLCVGQKRRSLTNKHTRIHHRSRRSTRFLDAHLDEYLSIRRTYHSSVQSTHDRFPTDSEDELNELLC